MAALARGTENLENGLFDFGVELQWRLDVFRKGQKAMKEFIITLPESLTIEHNVYCRPRTLKYFYFLYYILLE